MRNTTTVLLFLLFMVPCLSFAGTSAKTNIVLTKKLDIKLKFKPGLYDIHGIEREMSKYINYKKQINVHLCSGSRTPLIFLKKNKTFSEFFGRTCYIRIAENRKSEFSENMMCNKNPKKN